MPSLDKILVEVDALATELGWAQHHTPSRVLHSLVVEVAELMDRTLWMNEEDVDAMFRVTGAPAVADELADVLINVLALARLTSVDLESAVEAKAALIREKYRDYPRGSSRSDTRCASCGSASSPGWVSCPRCSQPFNT